MVETVQRIKTRKDCFSMKNAICTAIGVLGSVIDSLFGGWTASLTTL